ncbi:unnamed protein product (mitochondrion) [Plasmodiophora brassicae]|uniref:RMT2 domain-containing protein n=1 Tax=Plasmodiophora brassicae TaxID=37360 RepID=A0A0G4J462_PLABS|nr:hypothetical protein PBRA_009012 [Plasmodiophora brassicae]SPQ99913.1 unnamed protein product [Plasmodiophora brassicae]
MSSDSSSYEQQPPFIGLASCNLADSPHHRLLVASHDGDLATVRQLLDDTLTAPVDLAAHDQHGRTALALAAWQGHLEIVRLLLDRGAAWHSQDNDGVTCGEYAILSGHREIYDEVLNAGVRSELVLRALRAGDDPEPSAEYLRGHTRYTPDAVVDDISNGVMMAWETPLMQAHAAAMQCTGKDVLNVGFGMGIIDEAIQQLRPATHTIVEAHPDVYARMISQGWAQRPGVRIVFGKWQDALPQLGTYDAIMFDTFAESDYDLGAFHEQLLDLLRPDGVYTFFNGLAATNAFFHDVCREVTRLSLADLGLSVTYRPMAVNAACPSWSQVKDRYWTLDTYHLPICRFETVAMDESDF